MSHPFTAPTPTHPLHQKHAKPKVSDNFGFLASLVGDECADVNLSWHWNDLKNRTKAGGGAAFGKHWPDAFRNGYRWIVDVLTGKVRAMTHAELHRQDWAVAGVKRWRRGRSITSAAPQTYDALLGYVKRHGGTIVAELKSQAFAFQWIMQQLVATARRHDHAAWFKALATMAKAAGKCAATIRAGGMFFLIWGEKIRGRQTRLARSHALTRSWAVKPSATW